MSTESAAARPDSLTMLDEAALKSRLAAWGEPAFRAKQVLEFVYAKGAPDYGAMTSVGKALREKLAQNLPLYDLEKVRTSDGDDATKWLWKCRDGALVESVQIRVPGRTTSCLSSQVGCAMGCVFCATGLSGFERHLKAHEILEQYLQMWARSGLRSTHVVFMGMGEPLHNYDEVFKAIQVLNTPTPQGLGIGARRITVSTVGIVPGIQRLGDERLQIELAISLHAPDEPTRRKLIPASRRYPIEEIMAAVEEYSEKTRRIVTYEYVLLAGVNDSVDQARELVRLLRTHSCKVNLIPFNPVSETGYQRPELAAQEAFKQVLDNAGIPTTIRFSKGRRVDAACGQLRRQSLGDSTATSAQ